jgi:hypothetical protein
MAVEYGLLASRSSEIFSGLFLQIRDLVYSNPLPVLIGIGLLVIVIYFVFWR